MNQTKVLSNAPPKMRVVHIQRHPQLGAYSIETLFNAIASELTKHVELINYQLGPRKSIFRDILELHRLKADIYHVTGDVNYMIPFLPKGKTVLTIHDIGHYLFGLKGVKRWVYKWIWLVLPIRQASAVTAISETTKENIRKYLPVNRMDIQTVNNCYSPKFTYIPKVINAQRPVILQVGTRPYKNVPRLVQALKGIPCRLILIGGVDLELQEQLKVCQIDYESRTDQTSDQVIAAYIESDVVAFVSIGEGFGVPIIEAQATGRALVTAQEAPMCDVAGPGACLASAHSVESIRTAILRLIEEPQYREQVIKAGLNNAQRFAPASIANAYLAIYKQLTSK